MAHEGPLTGRDVVALECMKARLSCTPERQQPPDADEIVPWAFSLADAFVEMSNARWARLEREGDGETKNSSR